MKSSPFPGMDPYLEDRWREVHARLIVYAANQINSGLPNDLQANIEENLAVYANDHAGSSIRPDVHVADESALPNSKGSVGVVLATNAATVTEPLVVTKQDPKQDSTSKIPIGSDIDCKMQAICNLKRNEQISANVLTSAKRRMRLNNTNEI